VHLSGQAITIRQRRAKKAKLKDDTQVQAIAVEVDEMEDAQQNQSISGPSSNTLKVATSRK